MLCKLSEGIEKFVQTLIHRNRLTRLRDFCAHISQCGNLKSVSPANAQEILIPKFCNVLINRRKQLAPLVVYSSKRFGLITLHFRSLTFPERCLERRQYEMIQLPLTLALFIHFNWSPNRYKPNSKGIFVSYLSENSQIKMILGILVCCVAVILNWECQYLVTLRMFYSNSKIWEGFIHKSGPCETNITSIWQMDALDDNSISYQLLMMTTDLACWWGPGWGRAWPGRGRSWSRPRCCRVSGSCEPSPVEVSLTQGDSTKNHLLWRLYVASVPSS